MRTKTRMIKYLLECIEALEEQVAKLEGHLSVEMGSVDQMRQEQVEGACSGQDEVDKLKLEIDTLKAEHDDRTTQDEHEFFKVEQLLPKVKQLEEERDRWYEKYLRVVNGLSQKDTPNTCLLYTSPSPRD